MVVLADSTGDQLDVCATHHQDALRASDGAVRGIGLTTTIPARLPACHRGCRPLAPHLPHRPLTDRPPAGPAPPAPRNHRPDVQEVTAAL
ncbi:hypothetical protein [Pseudofrankia inefficax]|uniref:hypothetical protein n=1 Tax=Pseudofrankia inefficax (strain DSM 45817 / CECT 9037 / DDB 130130 / EuI1c) TaxID=298654 RepID=UPI00030DBDDA|nr:hypothetical protein [Pseudofrankia inefficax]